MTSLKAEPATIAALAAEIMAGSAGIAENLARLQSAAATLSGQWSGDAQQAYAAAQARWTSEMSELAAIANAAGEFAETWSRQLTTLERDLASGWPS